MDIERLTIGEVRELERISGLSLAQFGQSDAPKAGLMIGTAYVIKRREDPKVKVSDIENMTMQEIQDIIGVDEDNKS